MVKETVYCDVCTREKKETNSWWQIFKTPQRTIHGCVLANKPEVLVIKPYEDSDENQRLYQAACGTECLFKLINNYITSNQAQGVHR